MNEFSFANKLLAWFDLHGRKDLPWQSNRTPYRVWVSEIMLQQTQVASVINYYQRFMGTFPNIQSLASAHEDVVLEHWAGLGYYARARNLHKAAKLVVSEHKGVFPANFESIVNLPGIGRSTAGAILSIAFKQKATILDGNVKRVLCRVEAIRSWPGEKATENRLWQIAESLNPDERTADYTQAIMDLGATLCTRSKPSCDLCPLREQCRAHELNLQSELPKSKPKKKLPQKHTWIALIESNDGRILLEKRPPAGIWGSLYSLPEISHDHSLQEIEAQCSSIFGGEFEIIDVHESIQHTFSHYKLELKPVNLKNTKIEHRVENASRFIWFDKQHMNKLGLPAPISQYLNRQSILTVEKL